MNWPPLTSIVSPTMKLAALDARKAITLAHSTRRADAPERNRADERAHHLRRREHLMERRVDHARGDRVDSHAMRRQLLGERFRHRHESRFGRRVGAGAGAAAAVAGDRSEVHDRACAPGDHRRRHGLRAEDRALQVQRQHLVPTVFRQLANRIPADQRSRVVHQNVDRAQRAGGIADEALSTVHPPEIGMKRHGVAARLGNLARHAFGLVAIRVIANRHASAARGQQTWRWPRRCPTTLPSRARPSRRNRNHLS